MSSLTGRQIMLLLGCALALIIAGVGFYGLVRGPGDTTVDSSAGSPTGVEAVVVPGSPVVSMQDRTLPHTTDPIAYARAVAVSLFDWDTAAGFLPSDYTSAVLADGDPSGEETPGLLADVTTYLPTVERWLDLGAMEVVQTIEINDAYVPGSWAAAVEQAHGHLRPGTTAVTVDGTRHRSGVWNGEVAESSYPVSFTVFVACRPSFERCHVLRLSELDNPLR
ncbi:hypothetical protein [Nocardioides sp. Soil805]|uniref:hypothetical protein n=1 Tax=Nocardioides sp. Soil805 TaxID=1736416 RepID=UPI00070261EC|nr:hypothetical protein [Nocardioides sp. Soil805]KRF32276.1 hypothetical protein ASG94_17490 [Nocardioides sp. Soil805]